MIRKCTGECVTAYSRQLTIAEKDHSLSNLIVHAIVNWGSM